jgi:gamma-glutamyltranspeptidase/glutathione hydrolase
MQIILNVLEHKMSLSDAVSSPRFHHQWLPTRVIYEPQAFSADTRRALQRRGHNELVPLPGTYQIGDGNSVMRSNKGIEGMADPRNAGTAAGSSNRVTPVTSTK